MDISLYMDGAVVGENGDSADGNGARDNDSIAEPLYALMDEVFEMKGLFKWVRKSLISFVQISYGRTINRQIRDLIHGIFEEKNLHHCFSSILKSVWPGGVFQDPMVEPERTDDMKQATSMTAKQLVTENMPELLCNLVGAENCKHGVLKLFEVLQNEKYNKQLVYVSDGFFLSNSKLISLFLGSTGSSDVGTVPGNQAAGAAHQQRRIK